MTLPSRSSSLHLPFFQNESLLFQFLINEFLQTNLAFKTLRTLSFPQRGEKAKNSEPAPPLKLLLKQISLLTHFSFEGNRGFSFHFNQGSLDKLIYYCQIFSQLQKPFKKEAKQAKRYLMGGVRDLLKLWETALHPETSSTHAQEQWKNIQLYVAYFGNNFSKAASILIPIFDHYKGDENVLHFLLRKRLLIHQLFGPAFVSKLFNKFYPGGGIKKVEALMTQRLTQRGFQHLLPTIKEELSLLKKGR